MRGTATADGSFSDETKRVVLVRARSECERCGHWCGEGARREFHHRSPRGMGGAAGERAATISQASNCLLLCWTCHRWIESNRAASFAAGWLVPWGDDPAEVPAMIYRRGAMLLGRGYVRVSGLSAPRPARPGRVSVPW